MSMGEIIFTQKTHKSARGLHRRDVTHILRACLHGGGGPQVGNVTRLGGVTRLSIQSLLLM